MKCEYCGSTENLTEHHLIPRVLTMKPRKFIGLKYRRDGTPKFLPASDETMKLCYTCHQLLHKNYKNTELAEKYNKPETVILALNAITQVNNACAGL